MTSLRTLIVFSFIIFFSNFSICMAEESALSCLSEEIELGRHASNAVEAITHFQKAVEILKNSEDQQLKSMWSTTVYRLYVRSLMESNNAENIEKAKVLANEKNPELDRMAILAEYIAAKLRNDSNCEISVDMENLTSSEKQLLGYHFLEIAKTLPESHRVAPYRHPDGRLWSTLNSLGTRLLYKLDKKRTEDSSNSTDRASQQRKSKRNQHLLK